MNANTQTAVKEAFASVVATTAERFVSEGMNIFDAIDAAIAHTVKAASKDREIFAQTAAAFA